MPGQPWRLYQDKSVSKGGGGGGLYLTLHCYRQNDNEPVWPSGKALGW